MGAELLVEEALASEAVSGEAAAGGTGGGGGSGSILEKARPFLPSEVGKSTIQFGMDIYDYFESKREAKRLEKLRKDEARRFERKEDFRYDQNRADNLSMNAYQFAENKEQKNFNRGQNAINHFFTALAKQPDLENRFRSIWPRRR